MAIELPDWLVDALTGNPTFNADQDTDGFQSFENAVNTIKEADDELSTFLGTEINSRLMDLYENPPLYITTTDQDA